MRTALFLLAVPAILVAAPPAGQNPHLIDAPAARAMVKAWKDRVASQPSSDAMSSSAAAPNAIAFNAEALRILLNQPGASGVRFYFALNAGGKPTLVGFAYDANGAELPLAIENGIPCPPYC
ncbi:MAG TPA: hypothetical protein VJ623_11850 [Holophagaceae bacterium]|nr:hypothetical protein [Holophagaceae bacterium]